MTSPTPLGLDLRLRRVRLGLSRQALASEADISEISLRDWELGRSIPENARYHDVDRLLKTLSRLEATPRPPA